MQQKIKFNGLWSGHQGDVTLFSVDKIPSNAIKVEKQFIAKSEKTNHCHALCGEYEMFTAEGYEGFFVNIKGELAVMNHAKYEILTPKQLSKAEETTIADHKPTIVPKGIYYIGIQRRINPFKAVWEKVKD